MLNALFYLKNPFLTLISKRSTPTDLHHPDLHLAQFFSLESLIIFSAYAKTSLGLKIEKFLQTMWFLFGVTPGVDFYSRHFGAINQLQNGEQNLSFNCLLRY